MTTAQTEHEAIAAYLGPLLTGEACDPIIRQIPAPCLHLYWEHIRPDLERVIERTRGGWTLAAVAEQLMTGQWQLWLVWDGKISAVVGTELFVEASGMKNARAVFVGGREMKRWAHLIGDLEVWARHQGCARFEMIISKGIARHFPEYRMSHVLLEKDLTSDAIQQ